MSENSPSSAPGDLAVDVGQRLTPEAIDCILQEFRGWLEQAAQRAGVEEVPTSEAEFSWHTLVAEFTALRQEVNFQTRAARAQVEQSAKAVGELEEATRALEEAGATAEDKDDEALRPLIKTLVDAFDALALARREVERVQKQMEESSAKAAAAGRPSSEQIRLDSPHAAAPERRPWWRWRRTSPADAVPVVTLADLKTRLAQQERELAAYRQAEAAGGPTVSQARQVLASILVGYTMGLQRLERALTQNEVEPLDCVGESFDPESMEVVEVVNEPGREGTEVIEEVRRGYFWRGRLFRAAQVRVSRPA